MNRGYNNYGGYYMQQSSHYNLINQLSEMKAIIQVKKIELEKRKIESDTLKNTRKHYQIQIDYLNNPEVGNVHDSATSKNKGSKRSVIETNKNQASQNVSTKKNQGETSNDTCKLFIFNV